MSEKYQTHFGVKFCRDDKTGYYLNSTIRKHAHRFVWENVYGEIPKGFHVHHKDGNKSNNDISNLEVMSASDHIKMHNEERLKDPKFREFLATNMKEKALPAAIKWHKSEEGRKKHKEIGFIFAENCEPVEFECLHCNAKFRAKPIGIVKYCSNKCKSSARRLSGVDDITGKCCQCGDEMTFNKYAPKSTCSRACTNRYRAKVKRGEAEWPTP